MRASSPSPLPVTVPSEAGVDAAGILAAIDALESSSTQEPHGLMILRGGRVIAQGWWAPYTFDRPQLVYSLSKSFTAAAAGLLWDEGRLDLDAAVVDLFPEFADDIADPRSRRIRVRHVASMSSGHTQEMVDLAFESDDAEPVRGFLLNPPDEEPGSVFQYSQPTTYTLAAIVQRMTGTTLVQLLRERVLGPIGAGAIAWEEHPEGRNLGFSGSFMTTDTIARLGELLLRHGEWAGQRILSDEWVDLATRAQVPTGPRGGDGTDWTLGYGFQHWVSQHGFRGDGAYGQYCLVLPEHEMVIAYQGASTDLQESLDIFWEHVLPAVGRTGAPSADMALAARLRGLTLPALQVDAVVPPTAEWDGAVFAPVTAGGIGARVRAADGGWELTLEGSTGDVAIGFAASSPVWRLQEGDGPAVAVSGGFESDRRLRLDVIFVETPHRLQVELETAAEPGAAGTAAITWGTVPLGDPGDLRALAAPRKLG